ncbi:MAG: GxxExxY protein [Pedobacter sp.]|nr:MAG: GxxExxY protein [Pedobacter sp.]
MIDKSLLSDLEYRITGACIEVHKSLGPGLLESVYQKCLCREFELQEINFSTEQVLKIYYKGSELDTDLRADFYVENCIVVELKAVEKILPIHEAQLISYMKMLEAPKGLLINFNCINIIQAGKKSFVNDLYRYLSD